MQFLLQILLMLSGKNVLASLQTSAPLSAPSNFDGKYSKETLFLKQRLL